MSIKEHGMSMLINGYGKFMSIKEHRCQCQLKDTDVNAN